jgi:hypothetical protein
MKDLNKTTSISQSAKATCVGSRVVLGDPLHIRLTEARQNPKHFAKEHGIIILSTTQKRVARPEIED